jgi:hypothetical protein
VTAHWCLPAANFLPAHASAVCAAGFADTVTGVRVPRAAGLGYAAPATAGGPAAVLALAAGARLAGTVATRVPAGGTGVAGVAGSPDTVSQQWLARLSCPGADRDAAVAELHALLLRAARFEIRRRRAVFPQLAGADLDDLAWQGANDALMSILRRLGDFRGESRFTTWACKFAIVEAGAKVRRHAWQGREVPSRQHSA